MEYIIDKLITSSSSIEVNLEGWLNAEERKLVHMIKHQRNQAQELWLINQIVPNYTQACIYQYINAMAVHIRKQHKRVERCTNFAELSAHLRKQITTLVYTNQFLQQYKELSDFCIHVNRQFHTNVLSPPNEIDYRMIKLCTKDEYCATWFVNEFCLKYNLTIQIFNMSGHYYTLVKQQNFKVIEEEVDLYNASLNANIPSYSPPNYTPPYQGYQQPYQQSTPYQSYQQPQPNYLSNQGYNTYNTQITNQQYSVYPPQQQFGNYSQQSQYQYQNPPIPNYDNYQQNTYNQYGQYQPNQAIPENSAYTYQIPNAQSAYSPYQNYQYPPPNNSSQMYQSSPLYSDQTAIQSQSVSYEQQYGQATFIPGQNSSQQQTSNNDYSNENQNSENLKETEQQYQSMEPILKKSESIENLNHEIENPNDQHYDMRISVVQQGLAIQTQASNKDIPTNQNNVELDQQPEQRDIQQDEIIKNSLTLSISPVNPDSAGINQQMPNILPNEKTILSQVPNDIKIGELQQNTGNFIDIQSQEQFDLQNNPDKNNNEQIENELNKTALGEIQQALPISQNDNDQLNQLVNNINLELKVSQQYMIKQQTDNQAVECQTTQVTAQDSNESNEIEVHEEQPSNQSKNILDSWVVIEKKSYFDELFKEYKPVRQQLFIGSVPNLPTKSIRRPERYIQGFQNHNVRSLTIAQQYSDGVQAKDNYRQMITTLIKQN